MAAKAQWGPEVTTLGAAAREFGRRHSPWMILAAVAALGALRVALGEPSAGGTPSRWRRCSPSIRSASGRSTSTCCTAAVPDARAAWSSCRRPAPTASTTAHPNDLLMSCSTPKELAQLLLLAVPAVVAARRLLVGLVAGPVPLGALVSAALAGYVARRRLRVDPLPDPHRLPAALALLPRGSGETTACTTSRTSTTGTGSRERSATACSAPTPTSARCRARRPRAPSTRAGRGEPRRLGGSGSAPGGPGGPGAGSPRALRARSVVHADSSAAAATASATSARWRTSRGPRTRRAMGVAAARAEPVDGAAARRGQVAGVAGAPRAPTAQRRTEQAAAPARSAARRPSRGCPCPGHAADELGLEVDAVDARRARRRAPARTPPGARRAGRRHSSPVGRDDVERVAACGSRSGIAVSRSGPAGSERAATAAAASPSASSALRPFSGAEPECAATPGAITRSVAAALRFATTASSPPGPSWPASKHRQAS